MRKHTFKRVMAALLAVTLIIGAIPMSAFALDESCDTGLCPALLPETEEDPSSEYEEAIATVQGYWNKEDFIVEDDTLLGFSPQGEEKFEATDAVVIPKNIASRVAANAFADKEIKYLKISQGVVEIEEGAFSNEALKGFRIPLSLLTVEDGAFPEPFMPIAKEQAEINVSFVGRPIYEDEEELEEGEPLLEVSSPEPEAVRASSGVETVRELGETFKSTHKTATTETYTANEACGTERVPHTEYYVEWRPCGNCNNPDVGPCKNPDGSRMSGTQCLEWRSGRWVEDYRSGSDSSDHSGVWAEWRTTDTRTTYTTSTKYCDVEKTREVVKDVETDFTVTTDKTFSVYKGDVLPDAFLNDLNIAAGEDAKKLTSEEIGRDGITLGLWKDQFIPDHSTPLREDGYFALKFPTGDVVRVPYTVKPLPDATLTKDHATVLEGAKTALPAIEEVLTLPEVDGEKATIEMVEEADYEKAGTVTAKINIVYPNGEKAPMDVPVLVTKPYTQDDIDKLQKEIDDLKEKLDKCGANSEKLQEALDSAKKELADAKKLIEKKDKYIEQLEKRVRELGKLAADLGKLRSKLEAKLHAAQDAIDELKAEGEAKDARIAELEKELADAKAAIEKLEKALADSQAEVQAKQKEIDDLKDKLKKTEDSLATSEESRKKAEDALATSEESRKKTEGELEKTKKEKDLSDKEIERLKKELEEAKKSKDALMKEFQSLSKKYKEASNKGKESLKPLVSDAYKSLIPKTTKSERDNLVRSSFAGTSGATGAASTPTIVSIPKAGVGR